MLVNAYCLLHPGSRLFSGGSGITNGVTLGHCIVQDLSASAYSMLCRLAESMGESCQRCEYLFFLSWNGIKNTLKYRRILGFEEHLQITLLIPFLFYACKDSIIYKWHFIFPSPFYFWNGNFWNLLGSKTLVDIWKQVTVDIWISWLFFFCNQALIKILEHLHCFGDLVKTKEKIINFEVCHYWVYHLKLLCNTSFSHRFKI